MEEEMQHFLHEHPLKLVQFAPEVDHHDDRDRTCAAGCVYESSDDGDGDDDGEAVSDKERSCLDRGDDAIIMSGNDHHQVNYYGCDRCGFYLHESCAALPRRIEHFIHPSCPLFLKVVEGPGGEHGAMMLWYRCEACDFQIDAACGNKFMSGSSKEEEEEEGRLLLHFSHPHPLEPCIVEAGAQPIIRSDEEEEGAQPSSEEEEEEEEEEEKEEEEEEEEEEDAELRCKGCKKSISGKSYGCRSCGYYLDESCANLPRKIRHPFHRHPLFKMKNRHWASCDACEGSIGDTFGYKCKECYFFMHPECIQFSPIGSDEEGIVHFTHHHPLKLTYGYEEEADEVTECNGCTKLIAGRMYACRSCGYYLHESCGNLPRQIKHFFHPDCTLFLIRICSREDCDACFRKYSWGTLGYHCQKCDFTMHPGCAWFPNIDSDDEGDRIQHRSHHHPLKLSEESKDDLTCYICSEIIEDQAHGACEPCRFYIHKSCMIPEVIQHRCHPCPLFLRYQQSSFCNGCLVNRIKDSILVYECGKCEFCMDAKCALFSSAIIKDDQAERILHFCHHHPLQLFKDRVKRTTTDIVLGRKLECLVCTSQSSGLTYGCKECDVFLHKPCLDVLPQILSIQNKPSVLMRWHLRAKCNRCHESGSGFFFVVLEKREPYCAPCALLEALSFRVNPSSVLLDLPMHPCTLILKLFVTFNCNACFAHCSTHAYYCGQCDFYVGLKCAQLSAIVFKDGEEGIQHFCHWHPLQPSQDTKVLVAPCKICGILCSESSYFCSKCDFHVHKSCLDILPQKIYRHFFCCTFVLLTTPSYKCILCQIESDSGLAYHSIERDFKLCMGCFIRPKNKLNDDGTFTSIHHWHQLSLVDNLQKEAYSCCILCGGCGSGVMYYYCRQCKCYLHKTCAEMPFEMQHPLHPQHSLTLISISQIPEPRRSCSLCLREFPLDDTLQSGIYHCKGCNFQLDRKCASTCIPSIKYQGDRHLLTVVEYMYGQEDCRVCSASCKGSTNVFRCLECKFSLHLWCGPLPCDIKHPCHVHPLILEDFYVEENYTDKFPCHVCEEVRDPMLPVYRCAEGCPMICEIRCVISEVMPKLLGHHGGDVALRTTFPNQESKVIPRDEIFKGRVDVTHEEIKTGELTFDLEFAYRCHDDIYGNEGINYTVEHWEREMLENHGEELETAEEHEAADKKIYTFSKEAFCRFSSKLGCTQLTLRRDGIPEFMSQHGGRGPTNWEERAFSETLNPIYQEFHMDHTLRTHFYRFSPLSETYFIAILCAVMHNMRITKMVDVTVERVRQWLSLLKLVERAGVDVGFVVDNVKRVWEAHFLIKAKAILDETSDRLRKKQEELSRLEEELVVKLEATRREMVEVEEERTRHHRYEGTGMKSLRKEYTDALLIKWKPASSVITQNAEINDRHPSPEKQRDE